MAGAPSITPGIRGVYTVDPWTGLPVGDGGGSGGGAGGPGRIYNAVFVGHAMTVAEDVFEITVPAGKKGIIRGVLLNQYSDFGDAQAEILSVQIIRGYATPGTGGGGVFLAPVKLGVAAAAITVAANRTVAASAGTPIAMIADAWNVAAGWIHQPPPAERLELGPGIHVVRVSAPVDVVTANGTLTLEEVDT
jgi:hypothetical protein